MLAPLSSKPLADTPLISTSASGRLSSIETISHTFADDRIFLDIRTDFQYTAHSFRKRKRLDKTQNLFSAMPTGSTDVVRSTDLADDWQIGSFELIVDSDEIGPLQFHPPSCFPDYNGRTSACKHFCHRNRSKIFCGSGFDNRKNRGRYHRSSSILSYRHLVKY